MVRWARAPLCHAAPHATRCALWQIAQMELCTMLAVRAWNGFIGILLCDWQGVVGNKDHHHHETLT